MTLANPISRFSTRPRLAMLCAVCLTITGPTLAQSGDQMTDRSNAGAPPMSMKSAGMGAMSAANPSAQSGSPSTQAYTAANEKMHAAMMTELTGDADVDFVRGMIPHHQGAIDMARIELQYGKDPELRRLAEEIFKAQEQEIALMQDWLKQHGH